MALIKMSEALLKFNLSYGNDQTSQGIYCTEDIQEIADLELERGY